MGVDNNKSTVSHGLDECRVNGVEGSELVKSGGVAISRALQPYNGLHRLYTNSQSFGCHTPKYV
eukprot:975272-Pyramimonas_sp.AAC.1